MLRFSALPVALFTFALLSVHRVAAAQDTSSNTKWREPHGRYTILLPPGWNIESNSDSASMKISNGNSWAIFETSSNFTEPLDVARQSAEQMQPMYVSWHILNQGPFSTPLRHPAGGLTVGAAVNTRTGSQQVILLFVSQGAGAGHFVTMTSSVAQTDAKATNALLMDAFNSIRFGGE